MQTIDFKRLNLQPGDCILDLGCGEGRHCIGATLSCDDIHSVGVDLDFDNVSTTKKRFQECIQTFAPEKENEAYISLSVADGLQLPFADNSFDKIICSEVLEHIPDYHGVLTEINRVLKPNGLLSISVPRAWPERICWALSEDYHNVPGGHIRIFNANALKNEVETLGLRRYARHWAHALHAPFWWLRCIYWDKPQALLVRTYHRLLVWDLMKKPFITQTLETLLNPIMGKSIVMYFKRDASL